MIFLLARKALEGGKREAHGVKANARNRAAEAIFLTIVELAIVPIAHQAVTAVVHIAA